MVEQRLKAVEAGMEIGARKFDALASGQSSMLLELKANTDTTNHIAARLETNTEAITQLHNRLDAHVRAYNEFVVTVQPAITAVLTMQSGVRAIGKFGNGVAWVGRAARKSVVWLAPFVALATAVLGYIEGWFTRR